MDAIDERIHLIRAIKDNKISRADAEKECDRLERTYGEAAFTTFEMKKKPKPWTKAYYEQLKNLGVAGADSKAYVLHLAEVRDEVLHQKKQKCLMLSGAIVLAVGLIAFLIHLLFHN